MVAIRRRCAGLTANPVSDSPWFEDPSTQLVQRLPAIREIAMPSTSSVTVG
jgi:hypothetical protein